MMGLTRVSVFKITSENYQTLKRMSDEDRKAFLEERARKEAEAQVAAAAKARAEETKSETVRARSGTL